MLKSLQVTAVRLLKCENLAQSTIADIKIRDPIHRSNPLSKFAVMLIEPGHAEKFLFQGTD